MGSEPLDRSDPSSDADSGAEAQRLVEVGEDQPADTAHSAREFVFTWAFFLFMAAIGILSSVRWWLPIGDSDEFSLSFRLPATIFTLAWGLLYVVTGLGIRTRRGWARWVGVVLAVMVAATGVRSLLAGTTMQALGGALFGALGLYVVVALVRSPGWFDER